MIDFHDQYKSSIFLVTLPINPCIINKALQLPIPYSFHKHYQAIETSPFVQQLISWYHKNKRILPWRETNDPYKIWLSEIILQQTRVVQGLPYYQKFVKAYPSVRDLANAEEQTILRLWQGLGYYTRAKNLYACAKMVVKEYNGKFPPHYQKLLHLKGIGPYTAAAIASIAFKEPVPVVDGNVFRVLARVFGIKENIASSQGTKIFYTFAKTLVPQKKADVYNQAIMEFGAIHCTPINPKCTTCILKNQCFAFHYNKQTTLPVKNKLRTIRQRFFYYFVIQWEDKFYMKKRESRDIWQSLYDFYLIETHESKPPHQLEDTLLILMKHHQLNIKKNHIPYKHILTHQQLHTCFFHVRATPHFMKEAQDLLEKLHLSPFTLEEIKQLPKPVLINNFLKKNFFHKF